MAKIYISGKITGLPFDEAFARFEKAEKKLQIMGYTTVNPMKQPHNHTKTWEAYMREDIIAMMDCDSIYMLSGWDESKGACIEFELAVKLGMKIIYYNE
jgi:hypothetical protein